MKCVHCGSEGASLHPMDDHHAYLCDDAEACHKRFEAAGDVSGTVDKIIEDMQGMDLILHKGKDKRRIAELEKAHAKAINERDWMVDVLIEHWHENVFKKTSSIQMPEWLGWTRDQYIRWVKDPMDFPPVPEDW